MDRRLLQSLVPPRRRLGPDADHDDANLLDRYGDCRDERAFEELLTRHGPTVWGVCRRMLSRREDAEDAFQATFVALIRLAESRSRPRNLAGWLVNVAGRVCLKSRRSAVRSRQRQEKSARPETELPVADLHYDAAYAAFQDEVAALPEALRVAYLVCELGGTPQPLACRQLGLKPSALSARLTRARQRLEARLTARGLAPSVAAVVLAGTASTLSAMPTRLVILVQTLSATPATIPVALSILATQGVTLMATKLKLMTAGAMALAAASLTVGVGGHLLPGAGAQSPDGKAPPAATQKMEPSAKVGRPAPPKPPAPPAAAEKPPEPKLSELPLVQRLFHPEPLPGAAPEPPQPPATPPSASDLQVELDDPKVFDVGELVVNANNQVAAAKFEYHYHDTPAEMPAFKKLLEGESAQGFEFVGLVELAGGGKVQTLVFKREVPGPRVLTATRTVPNQLHYSLELNDWGTFTFGGDQAALKKRLAAADQLVEAVWQAAMTNGADPNSLVARLAQQAKLELAKKPAQGKSPITQAQITLEVALSAYEGTPADEKSRKIIGEIKKAIGLLKQLNARDGTRADLFGPSPVAPPAPPMPPAPPAPPQGFNPFGFGPAQPKPPTPPAAQGQNLAGDAVKLRANYEDVIAQYNAQIEEYKKQVAKLSAARANSSNPPAPVAKPAATPKVVVLPIPPDSLDAESAKDIIRQVYGVATPTMVPLGSAALLLVDATPEQEAAIRKLLDQLAEAAKVDRVREPKKPATLPGTKKP